MLIDIGSNGTNGNGYSALQNRGTSTTAAVIGEVNVIAYNTTLILVFLILAYRFGYKTILLYKKEYFGSSKYNCDSAEARSKSGSAPATKAKKDSMQLLFFVAFSKILICVISGANMSTKNALSGISLAVISIPINLEMILCVSLAIALYHLKEYAISSKIAEYFKPKPTTIIENELEAANKIVFVLSGILFAWLLLSACISGIITCVFGFSCCTNEHESAEITFRNEYNLGSLIISISALFWYFVYFILACTIVVKSADGVRFVSITLLCPNFVASWDGDPDENGDSVMTRVAAHNLQTNEIIWYTLTIKYTRSNRQ